LDEKGAQFNYPGEGNAGTDILATVLQFKAEKVEDR